MKAIFISAMEKLKNKFAKLFIILKSIKLNSAIF